MNLRHQQTCLLGCHPKSLWNTCQPSSTPFCVAKIDRGTRSISLQFVQHDHVQPLRSAPVPTQTLPVAACTRSSSVKDVSRSSTQTDANPFICGKGREADQSWQTSTEMLSLQTADVDEIEAAFISGSVSPRQIVKAFKLRNRAAIYATRMLAACSSGGGRTFAQLLSGSLRELMTSKRPRPLWSLQ